ncbi:MAG: YafY family transcriptional regulator [Burkholderiales bacterium]|nr:YafY family transcriptional regulator [Anaerolineae bacterium]
MYSPTTRLLTILELLQSYKHMSGSEMARRLEVDVRTVRRYIVMLQDMGIPVEAERGPYGAYQLQRGYKLPPLMFTDAEAVALTLGLISIRGFQFPVDVAAVEGALAKTERVMPERLYKQARGLQEAITFNVTFNVKPPTFSNIDFVTILSSAAHERRQVQMRYASWNGDESERAFDPYGIVFNEGFWYTSGYCHLREGLRTFRLDRIVALEPLPQSFERPDNFDTLDFVLKSLVLLPGTEQVEILFKTTLEEASQVIPIEMGRLEAVEAGVIFRRAATQLEWLLPYLLALEFPMVIIQPDSLRERLRQMAAKALQMADSEAE